jgi:hypothetical protein
MKTETETATTPKLAKTATITLSANDSQMQVVAERTKDGARTYVLTIGADKKTARGMTTVHPTWDEAVASTTATAKAAEKLGWTRRVPGRHFVAKPDAFTALPAAPKAGKK